MTSRIDWVRGNCRLLRAIAEEFAATQPFRGQTIGTGIHLEPKTVALLLTLKEGGVVRGPDHRRARARSTPSGGAWDSAPPHPGQRGRPVCPLSGEPVRAA